MSEILQLLATRLAFLLEPGCFRIVHSESGSMGNAIVVLESELMRVRISRDRSQLLSDIQFVASENQNWYGVHTVRSHVEGGRSTGLLDDGAIDFLRTNLTSIEQRVSTPDLLAGLEAQLIEIQEQGARERWGDYKSPGPQS